MDKIYILNSIYTDLSNKFITIEEIIESIEFINEYELCKIDESIHKIIEMFLDIKIINEDIEYVCILLYKNHISKLNNENIYFKEAFINCLIGILHIMKYKRKMLSYDDYDKGYDYLVSLIEVI